MDYFEAITRALSERRELKGWTVRHISRCETQFYAVNSAAASGAEAERSVTNERYVVDVLADTTRPGETGTVGAGDVTLLPGDDIAAGLDAAILRAGLVHNPPYTLPGPAELPDVPLADPALRADPAGELSRAYERLQATVSRQPAVRMTAAELYATEETTRLRNSCGLDVMQTATGLEAEWVLIARRGKQEVETFIALSRRRMADLDIEGEAERRGQYAVDLLSAGAPPDHTGAVVLAGEALADFLSAGVIQTLGSAQARFSKASTWEVGQPVFKAAAEGDPLNLWATRLLPYGVNASRFDDDGVPGQRVPLIVDNRLRQWSATQRYADYLGVPATGAFGDIEIAAGSTSAADLLAAPHVEITAFSWFNPDEITGDFASEIRLGYVVDSERRVPFKGGMLVGNVLDALAHVRWSAEVGFYGGYSGPAVARFGKLVVAA